MNLNKKITMTFGLIKYQCLVDINAKELVDMFSLRLKLQNYRIKTPFCLYECTMARIYFNKPKNYKNSTEQNRVHYVGRFLTQTIKPSRFVKKTSSPKFYHVDFAKMRTQLYIINFFSFTRSLAPKIHCKQKFACEKVNK